MEVSANTANHLYHELWWKMKVCGVEQESRNGAVISIPEPVMFTLVDPSQRILMDPVRDANPFFHIAEVVWMFSGEDDVAFIELFNSRYKEYADDNGRVWGAYGTRWLKAFDLDQPQIVINRLRGNPDDRQCVIGMWNPTLDLPVGKHNDRPCNTQVMFRIINDRLDMLVTNRSNDLVWGAMGANVVHFSYLQEVIARSVGVNVGRYRVVTHNLHVYPGMPRYKEIREAGLGGFSHEVHTAFPVLQPNERWEALRLDCEDMIYAVLRGEYSDEVNLRTKWASAVAAPMLGAYLAGQTKQRSAYIAKVQDDGWRAAAAAWWARRQK